MRYGQEVPGSFFWISAVACAVAMTFLVVRPW